MPRDRTAQLKNKRKRQTDNRNKPTGDSQIAVNQACWRKKKMGVHEKIQ